MAQTVKIEGLRELEAALAGLPKATAANVLRRVLKSAAEPTEGLWKDMAPKAEGALERSIHIGTRLTRSQARERKQDGKDFAEVYVGTSDPAGLQQEFGNINHPPQPSGRPAWEATKDRVLRTVGDELGAEIDKAATRLARKAARLAAKG